MHKTFKTTKLDCSSLKLLKFVFILNYLISITLVFFIGLLVLAYPTYLLTKIGRKYAHLTYGYGEEISKETEKVLDNLFLIKIVNFIDKLYY